MTVFAYKARDMSGSEVRGTLSADSRQAAMAILDQKALLPLDVQEASGSEGGGRRLGLGQLSLFYIQLAELLEAGVPILRSLDVLSRARGQKGLVVVVSSLRDDIAAGESLADSMAKHPAAFPELHRAMVAAGERGGFLEAALHKLGEFVERQNELLNKVITSLIYPALLVLVGLGVVVAIVTFFVPKFEVFLADNPNNMWLTDALFAMSGFIRTHWLWCIGVPVAGLVGLRMYLATPGGRRFLDWLALRAPMVGPIYSMVCLCRFCRVLGTLLHNGIPILAALQIARESAGNVLLAEQIQKAEESVRKGETLTKPLVDADIFPPEIMDMIAVGEETNQLDEVLVRIADTQEARTARRLEVMVRLIEPLVLITIALLIALTAVALVVPIMTLSSSTR